MLCFGYKEQCNHTNVKCQRGARGSSERLGVKVMNSKEKLVCRSVCLCVYGWCHYKATHMATDSCVPITGEAQGREVNGNRILVKGLLIRGINKEEDWPFLFLTQKHARIIFQVQIIPCQSSGRRSLLALARQERKSKGKKALGSASLSGIPTVVLRLNCLLFYLGQLRPSDCLLPLKFSL